jgi:hypothetical protein
VALDPAEFPAIAIAYRLSAVLLTAMDLGVAEAIAAGATTVDELAVATGTDRTMLRRLVRVLVASEVLHQDDDGTLSLSAFAQRMRADGDSDVPTMVLGWQGLWEAYRAYGDLPATMRTGMPPFERVFGSGFHDYLADNPDRHQRYSAAVDSTTEAFEICAASYPFDRFGTVVDIGGGRGGFLRSICHAHRNVHGVLVDLPSVLGGVEQDLTEAGCADRIAVVALDAIADTPPHGDVYLLSTVLRCFSDDDSIRMLTNIRAASPSAAVLVYDFVMDDRPSLPYALADIHNLATYGGRDRTRAEWVSVFAAAGYEIAARYDYPDVTIPVLEIRPLAR